MPQFDDMRRDAITALAGLNIGDDALTEMRRVADESIAELVESGFPRAAAGAFTVMAIVGALNSIPAFVGVKLAHLMDTLTTGTPAKVPIEVTSAVMIVLATAAPDPEWDHAEG